MLFNIQRSFATFFNQHKDYYESEADAFVDFLESKELHIMIKNAQKNKRAQAKAQVSNALLKKRQQSGTPSQETLKQLEKQAKAKGQAPIVQQKKKERAHKERLTKEPTNEAIVADEMVAKQTPKLAEQKNQEQSYQEVSQTAKLAEMNTTQEAENWRNELRANVVESLEAAGITTTAHFAQFTEAELLQLKWIGQKTIEQMSDLGLRFKVA